MKQLLTLLLLVFGSAVFAATKPQVAPVPTVESHQNTIVDTKKTAQKVTKTQESTTKEPRQKDRSAKEHTSKFCNNLEGSTLGLSEYFVDFIHDSNIKLVKLLM